MDIIQIPTTQTPGAGLGDVVGPASSTDNAIVRYDTTTGRLLQNSTVTIADSTGAIAGASSLTSPASTNLTLGLGTGGTALTLASSTLAATFAGNVKSGGSNNSFGSTTLGNYPLNVCGSGSSGDCTITLLDTSNANKEWRIDQSSGTLRFIESGVATPVIMSSTGLAITGAATISSTTAGSSGVGALIVQGGISAGNTGAASYFGGAVTTRALTVSLANLILSAGYELRFGAGGVDRIYQDAASGGTLVFDAGNVTRMTLNSTAATFSGAVTVTGALKLGNAYVAGVVVGTGSITIQDSTGTTYRIPVLV